MTDARQLTKLSKFLALILRHSVQVVLLVAEAAHHNRESRGCHYRNDNKGTVPI
jgi:aspartate oxidase